MSIYRQSAKVDTAQRPLVKALLAAGVDVYTIRQPCDLLLRFWCERHRTYCWQTMEVKTAYGKSPKPRLDRRQQKQADFLATTNTPIATDFDTAWRELNRRHTLGGVDTQFFLNPTV